MILSVVVMVKTTKKLGKKHIKKSSNLHMALERVMSLEVDKMGGIDLYTSSKLPLVGA